MVVPESSKKEEIFTYHGNLFDDLDVFDDLDLLDYFYCRHDRHFPGHLDGLEHLYDTGERVRTSQSRYFHFSKQLPENFASKVTVPGTKNCIAACKHAYHHNEVIMSGPPHFLLSQSFPWPPLWAQPFPGQKALRRWNEGAQRIPLRNNIWVNGAVPAIKQRSGSNKLTLDFHLLDYIDSSGNRHFFDNLLGRDDRYFLGELYSLNFLANGLHRHFPVDAGDEAVRICHLNIMKNHKELPSNPY